MITQLFENSPDTAPDPLLERLRSVTLGLYEIRGELGRGGMAVVYLAKDIRLERTVAIKVMLPDLLRTDGMAERFLQEARISARLSHQNIIVVHDVQQHGEIIFFVMMLVDGCGVDEICRSGMPVPIDEVRWILLQAAQALSYANGEGIVHRDVKPANILVNVKGDVIVTDFGIAKITANNARSMGATIIGTPLYMSPEQVTGQNVTEASDQYSLGVTAYTLLAGAPPFSGELSLYDLQTAHVRTRPVHVQTRRPDCPPQLANAVMRMLEKRPADRWPSLSELLPVLGDGLSVDARVVRQRLSQLAIELRNSNAQRRNAVAAETPVTPRPGSSPKPKPSFIVVSPPNATVFAGGTLEFSARVMTSAGDTLADAIVAWSTSDNQVADVSPTGVVRAVGPGTTGIIAAIGAVTAEAVVTVALAPIMRLAPVDGSLTLAIGDVARPTVRAIDSQGNVRNDATCSWISRDPGIVEIVGVGEVRALNVGTARVEIATGQVRIALNISVHVRPITIARIVSDNFRMECGDAAALHVEATNDRGEQQRPARVTWSSDTPHVIHVDATGTAIGLAPGRAIITALADGVRSSAGFEVYEAPIGSIELVADANEIEIGDTVRLTVRVLDVQGRVRTEDGVTVSCVNSLVAALLPDGRTLRAVASGVARVSARGDADVSITATLDVTVRAPVLARLIVSPESLNLEIGAVAAISVRSFDLHKRAMHDQIAAWQSLDASIASVDARGQVRALAAGTTTVRASAASIDGTVVSSDVAVVVANAIAAHVRITPPEPAPVASAPPDLVRGVARVSPSPAAADVNTATNRPKRPTATLIGAVGVVIVAAAYLLFSNSRDQKGTVGVTNAPPVAVPSNSQDTSASTLPAEAPTNVSESRSDSITLTFAAPRSGDVVVGARVQMHALMRATNTSVQNIRWSVSNRAIASIDQTGVLTAQTAGTVVVTATASNGAHGFTSIVIHGAPIAQRPQSIASVNVDSANRVRRDSIAEVQRRDSLLRGAQKNETDRAARARDSLHADSVRAAAAVTRAPTTAATAPVSSASASPTDDEVERAVERFAARVRAGFRPGSMSDFIGKGDRHRVRMVDKPKVVPVAGGTQVVSVTLELARINPVGTPETRFVVVTLQGKYPAPEFVLDFVSAGPITRAK